MKQPKKFKHSKPVILFLICLTTTTTGFLSGERRESRREQSTADYQQRELRTLRNGLMNFLSNRNLDGKMLENDSILGNPYDMRSFRTGSINDRRLTRIVNLDENNNSNRQRQFIQDEDQSNDRTRRQHGNSRGELSTENTVNSQRYTEGYETTRSIDVARDSRQKVRSRTDLRTLQRDNERRDSSNRNSNRNLSRRDISAINTNRDPFRRDVFREDSKKTHRRDTERQFSRATTQDSAREESSRDSARISKMDFSSRNFFRNLRSNEIHGKAMDRTRRVQDLSRSDSARHERDHLSIVPHARRERSEERSTNNFRFEYDRSNKERKHIQDRQGRQLPEGFTNSERRSDTDHLGASSRNESPDRRTVEISTIRNVAASIPTHRVVQSRTDARRETRDARETVSTDKTTHDSERRTASPAREQQVRKSRIDSFRDQSRVLSESRGDNRRQNFGDRSEYLIKSRSHSNSRRDYARDNRFARRTSSRFFVRSLARNRHFIPVDQNNILSQELRTDSTRLIPRSERIILERSTELSRSVDSKAIREMKTSQELSSTNRRKNSIFGRTRRNTNQVSKDRIEKPMPERSLAHFRVQEPNTSPKLNVLFYRADERRSSRASTRESLSSRTSFAVPNIDDYSADTKSAWIALANTAKIFLSIYLIGQIFLDQSSKKNKMRFQYVISPLSLIKEKVQ